MTIPSGTLNPETSTFTDPSGLTCFTVPSPISDTSSDPSGASRISSGLEKPFASVTVRGLVRFSAGGTGEVAPAVAVRRPAGIANEVPAGAGVPTGAPVGTGSAAGDATGLDG